MGSLWSALYVDATTSSNIVITLQASRPFQFASKGIGVLKTIRSVPTLQFNNVQSMYDVGYAHGYLTAYQIIDWWKFYLLEQVVQSATKYEDRIVHFLEQQFAWSDDFMQQAKGILAGMQDAIGSSGMYIAELKRSFAITELYAINAYIEIEHFKSAAQQEDNSVACSQFAFWNGQTIKDEQLKGQTIAARNVWIYLV